MAHPTLRPGDRLGPYLIEAELGRGGAGVVVAARSVEPVAGPRHVAIKARLAADGPGEARFQREIAALKALRVPGTVRLHAAGQAGPIAWFSMDRVEGQDLRSRAHLHADPLERCRLVARLAATLLETITGVHQRGFVHRDLKPGNVLVDGTDRVWLLDFGVTRGWRSPTASLTRPGTVVGTLPYMAPEQVSGQSTGPEVDIFAAGLLLHEAVAGGRSPARVPQEWLARQCLHRLPPLVLALSGSSPRLSTIVEAMLEFRPEDRPSAREAATELKQIAEGAPERSAQPQPPKFVGRRNIVAAITGAARSASPTLVGLTGPAGSGRRRTAEHVRRRLLLRGMVGHLVRCRLYQPGCGLRDLLATLIAEQPASPNNAAVLASIWPDLPNAPAPDTRADQTAVASAAADVIEQAASRTPRIIEIEEAQDIDPILGETLVILAQRGPKDLLVLMRVDTRWGGAGWRQLTRRVEAPGMRTFMLSDLGEAEALAIAEALNSPQSVRVGSPLGSAESAWSHLARQTKTPAPSLPWAAGPLGLIDHYIPHTSVVALGIAPAALADQGLLEGSETKGWRVAGDAQRQLALARLAERKKPAQRLFESLPEHASTLRAVAALYSETDALTHVIAAAEASLEAQQHRDARAWLLLADHLPREGSPSEQRDAFRRSAVRARVSLATDRGPAREDLVAQAERRAVTHPEQIEATILRAEYAWRAHNPDESRRLFAQAADATGPDHVKEDMLRRTRQSALELQAGHPLPALRVLATAPSALGVSATTTRHRAALWTGAPDGALSEPSPSTLPIRAQLLIGKPAAARQLLDAQWRSLATGGTTESEARLLLARLEAVDGRARVAARVLETVHLPADAPAWLPADRETVSMLLCLADADTVTGDRLAALPPDCHPPDWAMVASRWWRLRGDPRRAEPAIQSAAARMPGRWGQSMLDTLRAWCAIGTGHWTRAISAAERAHETASEDGYTSLAREARMLAAAAAAESDAAWSYLSARGARGRDPIKHLDALELDAIRRLRRHDRSGATSAWARLQRMALQSGWRLRAIHAQRQGSVLRGDAPATPPDTMSTEES